MPVERMGSVVVVAEYFAEAESLPTPCLVLYRDRMHANLRRLVEMAGDVSRLCPHLKTAKMEPVIHAYREVGIDSFKCATIAEAELAGRAGAASVLLAYPLVGPQPARFARLAQHFPGTRWSALADSLTGLEMLERAAAERQMQITVLMDIDVGMHRTGIAPGPAAVELYRRIHQSAHLVAGGLHIYDGHLHDTELSMRTEHVRQAVDPALTLRQQLLDQGLPVPRTVAGGSASFTIHRANPILECSPGTCVFWDSGYQKLLPEQPFEPAVMLLTRVISRPTADVACLDVGYKSVAAESPFPRLTLLGDENPDQIGQSEEHLMVRVKRSESFPVGKLLFAIPKHICPTIALHEHVHVVDAVAGGWQLADRWPVTARVRQLEF